MIHTAAERRPDVVEHKPEATHLLNVSATEHLCQEAGKVSIGVMAGKVEILTC